MPRPSAVAAGTRRSEVHQPSHAPAPVVNEYENMPEHYPGMHVCIAPLKTPSPEIIGPTVGSLKSEGYEKLTATGDVSVPEGHELMGISAETFKEWEDTRIQEGIDLMNPPEMSQSEIEQTIKNRATDGTFGKVGRAETMRAGTRMTLQEIEAVTAANQRVPASELPE